MKQRHTRARRQPLPLASRSIGGLLALALAMPPAVLAQPQPQPQRQQAASQPSGRFAGGQPVTVNFVNADIEGVTRAMAAMPAERAKAARSRTRDRAAGRGAGRPPTKIRELMRWGIRA